MKRKQGVDDFFVRLIILFGGIFMRILGISLRKDELHYAVIEGQRMLDSKVIELKKISVRSTGNVPELMNWFDSNFRELINKYKPDRIAYKLHLNTDKDQMIYLQFPMGVLNLICHSEKIPTTSRSTSYITKARKTIAQNHFKSFKDGLKDPELDCLVAAINELVM